MRINTSAIEVGLVKNKMDMQDLAEKIGMAKGTISTLMKGGNTTYTTAGKIAEALNINPENIIMKEETK